MNLIPELREAFVAGLIDGTLNPDSVPGGAQVLVFYDDMLRGDQVELRWMTSLPNGSYVDIQPVQGDGQPLPFSVPYYVLDAGRGLDATLDYSSARNGAVRQSYARLIPIRSTVVPLPPPTILSAKDPQNRDIAQGGMTTATTVTLGGEAAIDQQVQVFDGDVSKGIVQIDASGRWVHAVPGLASGAHSFTARGLYGANPQSPPRTLTVTAEVTPTIASVRDPQANEIANGGSTLATTVTLAGKASVNQRVEIFDGATSRGTASVNASGDWSLAVTGLSAGGHSFTARGLYGANPQSPPRTLTVTAEITPTITSVRDPQNNQVADGGSTLATTVTLDGKATPNLRVEVFDGAASRGLASVNASGDWSLAIGGLAVGGHAFVAKALYGSGQQSSARRLTVLQGFVFDESPYTLSMGGASLANGKPLTNPPAELRYQRAASGGVTPYTWSSSNPAVAVVNASGLISAAGRGTTVISVRDASGQSRQFTLTVQGGVIFFRAVEGRGRWADHYYPIVDQGGVMPTIAQLQALYNTYRNEAPGQNVAAYLGWGEGWCWSIEHANPQGSYLYAFALTNGATGTEWNLNYNFGAGIR